MFANGTSAITSCITYLVPVTAEAEETLSYIFYILNWFGLLVLTITLIHVTDLQLKYQLIDSNPLEMSYQSVYSNVETEVIQYENEENNNIRSSIQLE